MRMRNMDYHTSSEQGSEGEEVIRPSRIAWTRVLTLKQAQEANDGEHGVFYSPLTGLWVLVPDADSRYVPEYWCHVGR